MMYPEHSSFIFLSLSFLLFFINMLDGVGVIFSFCCNFPINAKHYY